MVRLALIAVLATLVTLPTLVHAETVDGYRRGKKVKIEVTSIGYESADVATAEAFLAMQAAAREDGVELFVYSGYRIYLGVEGTYAWLAAHAKEYGFKRTVRGEPWHWEYVKKPRKARKGKRQRPR